MTHSNCTRWSHRPLLVGATLVLGAGLLGGCTTTAPNSPQPQSSSAQSADARIDADAQLALKRLYDVAAGSRDMVRRAAGVLVFPKVYGGSFIVGAQHGQGVLLVHGRNAGYYNTTGLSVGWQAGAGSKAVVYVFNSADALSRFRASDGWQVGADAKVAVGHMGANGSVDTQTLSQPVVSFVMNNAGIEGGVALDGTKITRVTH